jgi:hypothetical protein
MKEVAGCSGPKEPVARSLPVVQVTSQCPFKAGILGKSEVSAQGPL